VSERGTVKKRHLDQRKRGTSRIFQLEVLGENTRAKMRGIKRRVIQRRSGRGRELTRNMKGEKEISECPPILYFSPGGTGEQEACAPIDGRKEEGRQATSSLLRRRFQ